MKFELKTENENYPKLFSRFFKIFLILSLLIVIFDLSLKLGNISRQYQINYHCSLLLIDKSASNFKKLSNLSNLKSKQKIWELCKTFVK